MANLEQTDIRFAHRLQDWQHLTGYRQREIIVEGMRSVLVRYYLPFPVCSGRKILFFSDLHWRSDSAVYREMIDDILLYIDEMQPDIVLFGGDLMSSMCHLQETMAAMKGIPGAAKIAVAGNWERRRYWISGERWREYFALGGFKLLLQEWFQDGDLVFFGADDSKSGSPEPPDNFPEGFRILCAHNPDTVVNIGRRDILKKFRLVLCGHTHGGQIRLPFWGALKTSSQYGTTFDYGAFYNPNTETTMIITSGMGYTMIRRRLLCQSEAVLIEF